MFCLAPLVLIGYMFTAQTSWHKTTDLSGGVLEVQTCERGLGANVKASSTGLYGTGLQYGLGTEWENGLSLTFQPKAGLSYADHPVYELPQRTQFEVGVNFLVGYDNFRIGLEYWHLSNAGMKSPNVGIDLIVMQTGWRFQ